MRLYIKNECARSIDICVGHATELTLEPYEEVRVAVSDEDYLYIDQVGDE